MHSRIKGRSTLFALWSCNIFWEWTGGSEPTQGDISNRPLWISHHIHFGFLIASTLGFSSHTRYTLYFSHNYFPIVSILSFDRSSLFKIGTVQVYIWKILLFAGKVLPKILPKVFPKLQDSLDWFSLGLDSMVGFYRSLIWRIPVLHGKK